jgi:DnaA-homolog protein
MEQLMQPQILDLFEFEPTFANFIDIRNENVVNSLKDFSNQFIHITGLAHSGKTHLLKAWVNLAQKNHSSAIYVDIFNSNAYSLNQSASNLSSENNNEQNIQIIDGIIKSTVTSNLVLDIKQFQFIAIDNVDAANKQEQGSLFDLFNQIKLGGQDTYLLTSSNQPLNQINIRQDLKTRLLSGLNLNLKTLNDKDILYVLNKIVTNEGIGITNVELNYLLNHYTRNIGSLITLIRKIADMGVIEKRNITIPLIKKLLLPLRLHR